MKVVNLWVGVSLWEAFSLTNNYIVSHQKLSMQLLGMEILKIFQKPVTGASIPKTLQHGNPSSATADTHSNPCERSRAFWHVGKAMSELQGSL